MPNPLEAQFSTLPVGKKCLTDSSGNEYNTANPFPTTATISGDVNVDLTAIGGGYLVGKPSGGDFATAYQGASTITISGLPTYHGTLLDEDIAVVVQIATGGVVTETYTRDDKAMGVSGGVLTITEGAFLNTDSFVIYSNITRRPDNVLTDDAAFSPGVTAVGAVGYLFNDAGTDSVDAGDIGTPRMSVDRIAYAEGALAHSEVDTTNPLKGGGYAISSQRTVATAGDIVDNVNDLYGQRIGSAYNFASGKDGVLEANPLSTHNVSETLAAVTNGADATYYYYLDMDGFRKSGLQIAVISGGSGTCTITLEGTIQDDGTAPASCTYQDISSIFGAINWTTTSIVVDDSGATGPMKYVRAKVVAATGAADDADWTLYAKKLY